MIESVLIIIFLVCTFIAILPTLGFIVVVLLFGAIFKFLFGDGSK